MRPGFRLRAHSLPTARRPRPTPPPINYLAKDYGSFRTLILDRLNQLLPGWGATSEADLGVALAELIAYVGDHLSYQQDAVATEAYLETARSRVSLRRHAVLVDYHVHDGCNARAWIQLRWRQSRRPGVPGSRSSRASTPSRPACLPACRRAGNEEAALLSGVQVFEPMHDAVLYPEHNQIPSTPGATRIAACPQARPKPRCRHAIRNLQPGDVLIFQEMMGPQTGNAADADMRHRCAVRLTQVATHGLTPATAGRIASVRGNADPGDRDPMVQETRCRFRFASRPLTSDSQQRPANRDRCERGLRQRGAGRSRSLVFRMDFGNGAAVRGFSTRAIPPPIAARLRRPLPCRCASGRSFPTAR